MNMQYIEQQYSTVGYLHVPGGAGVAVTVALEVGPAYNANIRLYRYVCRRRTTVTTHTIQVVTTVIGFQIHMILVEQLL